MGFLTQIGNSRFLAKGDADAKDLLLTITGAKRENVAAPGEQPKQKVVLYFAETEKGMVLGKTTANQIASFLGDPGETPEKWFGQKIVVFHDRTVIMRGECVGGLRVRQPRNQPQQPSATSWQQAAPQPQQQQPGWMPPVTPPSPDDY
jgi:hypothetical protein